MLMIAVNLGFRGLDSIWWHRACCEGFHLVRKQNCNLCCKGSAVFRESSRYLDLRDVKEAKTNTEGMLWLFIGLVEGRKLLLPFGSGQESWP